MKYQGYVLGFLFSNFDVALIKKTHPEYQKGKLNGIGGKIEPRETPLEAMEREFFEETGFKLSAGAWSLYLTFHCVAVVEGEEIQACTYLFRARIQTPVPLGSLLKSNNDEDIIVLDWRRADCDGGYRLLHNVPWFIRMALFDKSTYEIHMKEVER